MTPIRYRSKIVEIYAMLWDGTDACYAAIKDWAGAMIGQRHNNGAFLIATPEGNVTASVGDYIIKGTIGEFYPCKPEVFEHKYEAAS